MRYLEIRRHSIINKDPARISGSDLSNEGVKLARRVGEHTGPFHAVYTSSTPRTLETAIAMGHAVTAMLHVLGDVPTELLEELGHHERWSGGNNPFSNVRKHFATDGSTRRLGSQQRDAWLSLAAQLPESASALIISHAMVIEAGLVASVKDLALEEEPPFGYCEGVRLAFDGRTFLRPTLLRIDEDVEPSRGR